MFKSPLIYCLVTIALCVQAHSSPDSLFTGYGANRPNLFKTSSNQALVETARDHNWSINFSSADNDTLLIIALRVDFREDTSTLATGNGKFGMRGDSREQGFINDGKYEFDQLPHDSLYFARQFDAVSHYYSKVSRGKLTLQYEIYPPGTGETGYTVPNRITHYSPGHKRRLEGWDEYYNRKTYGLMEFVRDAFSAAQSHSESPFRKLYRDEEGVIRDTAQHRKVVFMLLHAGASYLTDANQDSQSDMIDAFINEDFFRFFQDTLDLDTAGIAISGSDLVIQEVMMCSETSNQDGLNWGIQGILVNQIARQLGIPDLFSTSSGISAVGAFCIMDFAGYSAGQGFMPPYPSAWVRAFMGWDRAHVATLGDQPNRITALAKALERNSDDTTILLIPINDHEYYLLENRQRNLSGETDIFEYDTINNQRVIRPYPFNVNLSENVDSLSSESNVVLRVKNNDVSLPASGVLVWHIDERVIRKRLPYNLINADSTYRGIRLVEADGINDLGVTFTDMFYRAAFDYGGAEDIFPYQRSSDDSIINSFGPYSRPSTRSNDGGHTYLNIRISPSGSSVPKERTFRSAENDYFVYNFADSVFEVFVRQDYLLPSWPKKAAPDYFFDPLAVDINPSSAGKELVLLGASGRYYVFGSDVTYGNRSTPSVHKDFHGNVVENESDSIIFLDSIPGAFTFSTEIDGAVFTPSSDSTIHVLHSVNQDTAHISWINLPGNPSSYITGTGDSSWTVGLADGRVLFGSGMGITDSLTLASGKPVNAIALLKETPGQIAVVQSDGTLSLCTQDRIVRSATVKNGIPPYTIVTGDLNRSGSSEIVISDSRQGVWVYTSELRLSQGWNEEPNDWANIYHREMTGGSPDRSKFHYNVSSPVLGDISRNGYLDIIQGGTNGVYALNYKGVLLSGWPAYLDNRYWYQRGSISSSPIVVTGRNQEPLVLFASPTGENPTFTLTKIITADRERGVVTYEKPDGAVDSIWELSKSSIDTILTINDSLIAPYILPGGYIDALNSKAKRPFSDPSSLRAAAPVPQSTWPITTGSSVTTSPLAVRMNDTDGNSPDLIAVTSAGQVYRWRLPSTIMPDSLFWPQTGYDNARSFAYMAGSPEIIRTTSKQPIEMFSYPNPTAGARNATFKYQFSGDATDVRVDIFSITGFTMDSFQNLSGSYPDWNELTVGLREYGPGVYRCRMEATINGKNHVTYWKLAVTR